MDGQLPMLPALQMSKPQLACPPDSPAGLEGEGFLSQAPQGLPSFQAPELQFPTFQPTPITTAQMVPAAQAAAPAPTPVPAAPAEPAAAPAPTEVAAALQAPPPEAEAQPILASNPYAYGLQARGEGSLLLVMQQLPSSHTR